LPLLKTLSNSLHTKWTKKASFRFTKPAILM
jgi:hypothetical protein